MRWRLLFPFLVLGFFSHSNRGNAGPDPRSVTISNFTYSGTACPASSVFSSISPDAEVITLIFNEFVVEKNGATDTNTVRKACRLNFDFNTPIGWTHSLFSMQVDGAADLEAGTVGRQDLRYRYEGRNEFQLGTFELYGAYADDYSRVTDIPLDQLQWAPCDRRKHALNLNARMEVGPHPENNNAASGFMRVDAIEGAVVKRVGLIWRRCPGYGTDDQPWFASCHGSFAKNGKPIREFLIRARGRTEAQARAKLEDRIQNRCSRGDQHGRTCVIDRPSCQVGNISNN